ncbi:MAG: lysophospholipid acyltransferase family protein [Candidatus Lernaella stagnicola]|nr:lysophospholipid acyltransferase family protein [Candidatus Lernaella stagnicola]
MRHLRLILALPIIFVSAVVLYSGVLVCAPFDRRRDWVNRVFGGAWFSIWKYMLGVHVRVEGRENIEPNRSYIFVANHTSYLDVMAIITDFPVVVRFLAMKTLVWIPIFGISLYTLDHVFIDHRKRATHRQSLDAIARKTDDGKSILIFPGGGRAPDGRLGEWKKGAFVIATQLHVPLVPVAISGSSRLHGIGDFGVRPGTITIRIGKPIATEGASYEDRNRFLAAARQAVEELLNHDTDE